MIFDLPKFGDGVCIDRIQRFYAAHGVDRARLAARSIVITGSKGKGSTARFVWAALGVKGKRVGCFTSPHLFDVRERFALGETLIPQADFDRHAATVLAFARNLAPDDRLGAFEALFLIAILWFEAEQPDAIVWEAGIGGRYDPVRTLEARVSALTSVELEHTEILGGTEELIAFDKVDALASGGALVVSPSVSAELAARVASYARLTHRTPVFAGEGAGVSHIVLSENGTDFEIDGRAAHLAMIGAHQVDNAVTALALAQAWAPDADRVAMLNAMARVRWRGRLERISDQPDVWIDVGHTPHAAVRVIDSWRQIRDPARTLLVFGVTNTKDIRRIAALAAKAFPHAILTRAWKAGAEISAFADVFAGCDAVVADDTAEAARLARARAERDGMTVLAFGGTFLAAEFEHAWKGKDPRELRFL